MVDGGAEGWATLPRTHRGTGGRGGPGARGGRRCPRCPPAARSLGKGGKGLERGAMGDGRDILGDPGEGAPSLRPQPTPRRPVGRWSISNARRPRRCRWWIWIWIWIFPGNLRSPRVTFTFGAHELARPPGEGRGREGYLAQLDSQVGTTSKSRIGIMHGPRAPTPPSAMRYGRTSSSTCPDRRKESVEPIRCRCHSCDPNDPASSGPCHLVCPDAMHGAPTWRPLPRAPLCDPVITNYH